MPVLVWFRNDLRVDDNPALHQACQRSDDGVIAVFLLASQQWRQHDWGLPKVDFVLRNVAALSTALAACNIPLLVLTTDTFADAPRVLLRVIDHHHCSALMFNREYEWNERQRDQIVVAAMQQQGIPVQIFEDQVCLAPDCPSLQTNASKPYTVFTPFKKKWVKILEDQGLPTPLPAPVQQPPSPLIPTPVPSVKEVGGMAFSGAHLWPAGEAAARARLEQFLAAAIHTYGDRRNLPSIEGTSSLSPYLACGVISIRVCLAAAVAANHNLLASKTGPGIWISELIWREFYRHVLVHFPRVCKSQPFKQDTATVPWRQDQTQFDRWAQGQTGIPIVDAGMRQLNQTGWMHNRLRMITAMFLTKDLLMDWHWGERYFMQHLVDGDFASNNGGWQWSASTGTDAAPYFRIFNPYSQSRKFDPEGQFIRRYCPELASLDQDQIHHPAQVMPLLRTALNYPEPIVDHSDARLRTLAAFKQRSRSSSA